MSKLSQGGNTRYNNQIRIGEFVSVLVGDSANTGQGNWAANNTYGDFVACNGYYSQDAYPDLANAIGVVTGTTLKALTYPYTSTTNTIAYGNGLYVLNRYSQSVTATINTTTDFINYTARTVGTYTKTIRTLGYGLGLYVFGGDEIGFSGTGAYAGRSTDAINWVTNTTGTTNQSIYYIRYGLGIFFYVDGNSKGSTSTNGINWATPFSINNNTTAYTVNDVKYVNGLYIYVNNGAAVWTSTNATSWTQYKQGTLQNARCFAYGNGFYWVHYYNSAWQYFTTTNFTNWVDISSTTTGLGTFTSGQFLYAAEYASGLFIAYAYGVNKRFSSTNAVNWSQLGTTFTYGDSTLFYQNGVFLIGGGNGQLLTFTTSTQIYVPDFRNTTLTLATNTAPSSNAVFRTYVRAK